MKVTSFNRAKKIITTNILKMSVEYVKTPKSFARIAAKDLVAREDIPIFANSAMDGYLIKARLIKKYGQEFEIGKETFPIMTGRSIMDGFDTVVPVENVKWAASVDHSKWRRIERPEEKGKIKILKEIKKGKNIRLKGEDVKKGRVVLKKGKKIGPGEFGMVSAIGLKKIPVYAMPKIAILSTGNELIRYYKKLAKDKVRDANSFSLYGLVKDAGGIPIILGIAKDKLEDLKKKIKKGFDCDILLISGGVSKGRFDLVRKALKETGYEEKFWGVKQKPGKPLSFGRVSRKPVFCLPGNPVSVMICFIEYVKPLVLKMTGRKTDISEITAILKAPIRKKDNKRHFLRVKLEYRNGKYLASLTGNQGSGILRSMVDADGILVVPEKVKLLRKGDRVKVQLLRDF